MYTCIHSSLDFFPCRSPRITEFRVPCAKQYVLVSYLFCKYIVEYMSSQSPSLFHHHSHSLSGSLLFPLYPSLLSPLTLTLSLWVLLPFLSVRQFHSHVGWVLHEAQDKTIGRMQDPGLQAHTRDSSPKSRPLKNSR